MNKKIKIAGLLVLGAVLGQVLVVGVSVLHLIHKITSTNFLMQTAMLGTAPDVMSNEELRIWNKMRDDIRHDKFADVNRVIQITQDELDFEVIPAKPTFVPGESILAEIRFKNVSGHAIHINEPREVKLTPDIYYRQGLRQFDYMISTSPWESTWMRTVQPGERLSIPILIAVTNIGPYQINYSLSIFQFDERRHDNSVGTSAEVKRAACSFAIQ